MNKKISITAKLKYSPPIIEVEELEKHDVLTASDGENRVYNADQLNNYQDFFTTM